MILTILKMRMGVSTATLVGTLTHLNGMDIMTWNDMAFGLVWSWLKEHESGGLGNFIPSDVVMQDLIRRISAQLEEVYWYGRDTLTKTGQKL